MNNKKFDFCHYDSDKSYQGRMFAYNKIWKNLKKKGIFFQMIFLITWPF